MSKREKVVMSVKSFDQLKELLANPPSPNEALVAGVAKYKQSVVSQDGETTTLNINTGDATMR
jgi:hypothetical protein